MGRPNLVTGMGLLAASLGAAASAQATTITEWNFGTLATVSAPDNTPAPTTGSGSASSLGMTNSYTYPSNQSGGGGTQTSSTTADDLTNDSPYAAGNGDVWRIRGATTAGNGWNNSAPQYTQGAQFLVDTTGYDDIDLSFSWASTTQGIANLQVQYTTNGSTWANVGSLLNATIDSASGGGYQTDTINFGTLGITSVDNDPDFGIRLVSAYNPTLGNEYASATSVESGSPAQYNDYSGNWRFADVSISGTSISPVPPPAAAWLLLSGLGTVGALGRKRKAVAR